jgi:hypothetical protein
MSDLGRTGLFWCTCRNDNYKHGMFCNLLTARWWTAKPILSYSVWSVHRIEHKVRLYLDSIHRSNWTFLVRISVINHTVTWQCDYRRLLMTRLIAHSDIARDYILQFTITYTLVSQSTSSLPLLGIRFQRRKFPFLRVSERSQTLATSF